MPHKFLFWGGSFGSFFLGGGGGSANFAFLKEEGRGTRNGYEASKGSKGISGL